jgi:histone H3/H4
MSTIEEAKFKELVKQAFLELLDEHRELFEEILADLLEDAVLNQAIREGETTETVSREDVFAILESDD